MSTTVVIADDHGLVRRGTREILEDDPEIIVVGEAADGSAAVALVERLEPDVALLDIGMPGMNGVEATRHIRARWPQVGILILTVHDDAEYLWRAIKAGASGYLRKDASDERLVAAVRTISEGGYVLDPGLTAAVIERLREPATHKGGTADELTARELEVMEQVARGLSNRAIGESLGMSSRTVEVHVGRILKKLQVSSRTEAVVAAVQQGLVALDQ